MLSQSSRLTVGKGKILYDTLFLAILLLAFSIQHPATIAATYLLCATYVFTSHDKVRITKNQLAIYVAASFPCLFSAINFNHGITPVFYLAVSPFVILAAMIFGAKSHDHVVLCLRNVFWLFFAGIATGLAIHWDDPEPLGAIIPGSSTNGLPSYLIVVQIAFAIAYYLRNARLPLLSSAATLFIAVIGLGRGSMIIGVSILLFSLSVNVIASENKGDRKIFLKVAGLFALPIGLHLYTNFADLMESLDLLIESSKFSTGVLDEHRGRMLTDYLNKIDAWSFLFGTDYNGTSIVQDFGGNPHNSFIRVHSFYGIAGLSYVVGSLLLIALSNRRWTHKGVTLVMVILALMRATTEPIFFPATLDFFYYLYFIIYFNYSKRKG